MKIGLGNDHAGTELKFTIMDYLKKLGYETVNYGTDSLESYDYPIAGERVARAVAEHEVDLGIVICGTGIGISLAANKVKGIRCAPCSETFSAKYSRMHNNTNMLALGARVVGTGLAEEIVHAWLSAEFMKDEPRHVRRVEMIREIEEGTFKEPQK